MNRLVAISNALRPWAAPIALVIATFLFVRSCNHSRNVISDLERSIEAERLRAEGVYVAGEKKASELAAEARRLAGENSDLARALEEARRKAPSAKPAEVVHSQTGPVVVGPVVPLPCPVSAQCVLRQGDTVSFEVDEVHLKTDAGNEVIVGTAAAWRLTEPKVMLARGSFQAALSAAAVEAPERRLGWGAGVAVAATSAGWAVGPAVALPPLRLWSAQVEATVGAVFGGAGTQGTASAVLRW